MPREANKLSERTKKQINDGLPGHGPHIFKKTHKSALKRYRNPSKRQSKNDKPEKVAHKVAWSAVKKKVQEKREQAGKQKQEKDKVAGPEGFDPTTCGSEDRRDILTTLRAQYTAIARAAISSLIDRNGNEPLRTIMYSLDGPSPDILRARGIVRVPQVRRL